MKILFLFLLVVFIGMSLDLDCKTKIDSNGVNASEEDMICEVITIVGNKYTNLCSTFKVSSSVPYTFEMDMGDGKIIKGMLSEYMKKPFYKQNIK